MVVLCPICNIKLDKYDKTYKCFNGHTFDIAKEGYLNLNHSNQNGGDSKESINARKLFLNKDHYAFLKEELINIIDEYKANNLLDLACGEGYYTKDFPIKDKIGIDLSKTALKQASKRDKNTLYLLTSIFNIPLEDNSIDIITTIFAPLANKEINRLLKTDGHFIYVRPNENHLIELKDILYKEVIKNEIKDIVIEGLIKEKEYNISKKVNLNNEDLLNLFMMTPYFYKTSNEDKNKLETINNLDITFDFIISIYKKI